MPSALFTSIRPHYRDRVAHHCQVLGTAGGGIGGSVATFLVNFDPEATAKEEMFAELANKLTRLPAVTAAHFGLVDWTVPIRRGGKPPVRPSGDEALGVIVVESYDGFRLAISMADVETILFDAGAVTKVRN